MMALKNDVPQDVLLMFLGSLNNLAIL